MPSLTLIHLVKSVYLILCPRIIYLFICIEIDLCDGLGWFYITANSFTWMYPIWKTNHLKTNGQSGRIPCGPRALIAQSTNHYMHQVVFCIFNVGASLFLLCAYMLNILTFVCLITSPNSTSSSILALWFLNSSVLHTAQTGIRGVFMHETLKTEAATFIKYQENLGCLY